MKNNRIINSKIALLFGFVFILNVSCERDLSHEVEFATMANTGEIFTDSPIGLGSNFYFPFLGSKPTAWSVDDNEGYESESSMRFDVPNADDPEGSYAGAIFRVDGAGRDLTDFDALTFWIKASQGVTIGELGFGQDFLGNKYSSQIRNTSVGTNWTKIIIPIPDASKLFEERGMFWYSAGTQETGGLGYTFWVDDLKFEKLGTIGSPRPIVFNGEDANEQTFLGTSSGFQEHVIFNLPSGEDVHVDTRASYFDWTSSDPSVIEITEIIETDNYDIEGSAIGIGTSVITASLAGVQAEGSLTMNVLGEFNFAPMPTRDSADVISIFSDAYTNVPVDYYNGYFIPDGQTTKGGADILINGDNIISYTDLNFVGIGTFLNVAGVNATDMTHLHVDLNIQELLDSGDSITLQLLNDIGGNETSGLFTIDGSQLLSQDWKSFDIPLDNFSGLGSRNDIGLLFFISNTISNIFVDNIYYFKE